MLHEDDFNQIYTISNFEENELTLFNEVYNLSHLEESNKLVHLTEETAERFVNDAMDYFKNKKPTPEEIWDWLMDRITNEIQTPDVRENGYLEGLDWQTFFNEVANYIKDNTDTNNRNFYKELFWYYKRALWGLEDIKDEKFISLKNFDTKHDKAYQNTEVHGNHGIEKNVKIKDALKPWYDSKLVSQNPSES